MRFSRLLIPALIFSVTVACHRSPCDIPAPDPASSSKVEEFFSSPEGGFKIRLPSAKPFASDSPKGTDEATRFKWVVLNHGSYEITYYDLESDIETTGNSQVFFDRLRDSYLAKGPAQLELDKDLRLSGHPGREIRFSDDAGLNIRRFYVVRNRLYIVVAFVPRKLDCAIDRVIEVLDTFEFVGQNSVACLR